MKSKIIDGVRLAVLAEVAQMEVRLLDIQIGQLQQELTDAANSPSRPDCEQIGLQICIKTKAKLQTLSKKRASAASFAAMNLPRAKARGIQAHAGMFLLH